MAFLPGPVMARKARRRLGKAFLACSLALGGAGPAAEADPLHALKGESLDVAADSLDVQLERGVLLLDGNVRARLGELEIFCAHVELHYDQNSQVRSALGSGGVRAKLRGVEASAKSLELSVSKRTLKLLGGVRVSRGRGFITAQDANLDLATRKLRLNQVKGSIPIEG